MPKLEIQATSVDLTPDEIRLTVGASKLRELSGKGVFHAYTIAHEGESKPKALGTGYVSLKWPKTVVDKIETFIKLGTKFFKGHGEGTNAHDGRKSVGETVGTLTKNVNGRATSIVIGHFPDAKEVENLDVVSMEAEVETADNVVTGVDAFTAIAMGDSKEDSPAFVGATRLASLQCFTGAESTRNLEKEVKKMTQEEINTAPFEMLKAAIMTRKVWPSQLYTTDEVKKDHEFRKDFDELVTLRLDVVEKDKSLKTMKEEKEASDRKASQTSVKETFAGLLKTGLTDKQKAYIEKRFNPETVKDLSETGLKAFIEEQKKEYADMAKMFGVTEPGKAPTEKPDEGGEPSPDVSDPVAAALAASE